MGRDSPGIKYNLSTTVAAFGAKRIESTQKSAKAFGFGKSVKRSIFDQTPQYTKESTPSNEQKEKSVTKPFNDIGEWKAKKVPAFGKAVRDFNFNRLLTYGDNPSD